MIIFKALEFVRLNLKNSIMNQEEFNHQIDEPVKLGNIAFIADNLINSTDIPESIYMTLVNMQEEAAFKNQQAVRINEVSPDYSNPPMFLNLFILITSCFKDYNISLEMLSYVIQYFQGNKTFRFSNKPVDELVDDGSVNYTFSEDDKADIQLIMDIYSMTFEQLNHLWGSLGGKQVPFVLYKARVLEIDTEQKKKGGGYIEEIQTIHPKV